MNRIRAPSGDQLGTTAFSIVSGENAMGSRHSAVEWTSTMSMTDRPSLANVVNAIDAPSGDQTGWN